MAKPPLSMKPTGWFQVAWSDEIKIGDVHRMTYFDTEMVAWRAESGQLTVMDAYCEHLGAHLGYGGHVEGEVIQCPFHGWQWNHEGRNVCIPYQDRPNRGRRIRTYPVVERNESVYIWHDIERRDPFFDAPDVFASFADDSSADDYYPQQRLFRETLEMHPQYVLENGVDFAHFKFVHQTPIVPVFTRHDFDDDSVLRRLHDHLRRRRRPEHRRRQERRRGDQRRSRHRGDEELGHGRQPDHLGDHTGRRPHLRCSLHGVHRPHDRPCAKDPERAEAKARDFGEEVIRQFAQDVHIWQHQRYSDPPALASAEQEGFTAIRKWAKTVLSRRPRRQRRRTSVRFRERTNRIECQP